MPESQQHVKNAFWAPSSMRLGSGRNRRALMQKALLGLLGASKREPPTFENQLQAEQLLRWSIRPQYIKSREVRHMTGLLLRNII